MATAPDTAYYPNAIKLPPFWYSGTTPPDDLSAGWIDTTDSGFVANAYNTITNAWEPIANSPGAVGANAQVSSLLTASFTAGAPGATGLLVNVVDREWLQVGAYVLVIDMTGELAVYQITAWSTDPDHLNGLILTRADNGTAAMAAGSAYSFTTANGTQVQITGLPASASALAGVMNLKGTWNGATNTPTLASGVGTQGDVWVVNVAGTVTLDGVTVENVGDWLLFVGGEWTVGGGLSVPLSASTPQPVAAASGGSAGTSTQASASDHVHAAPVYLTEGSGSAAGSVPSPGYPAAFRRVLTSDAGWDMGPIYAPLVELDGDGNPMVVFERSGSDYFVVLEAVS